MIEETMTVEAEPTIDELITEAIDAAADCDISRADLDQHCQYKFGRSLGELDHDELRETRDLFWEAAGGKGLNNEKVTGRAFRKDLIQKKPVKRTFTDEEIALKKNALIEALNEKEELEKKRTNFLNQSTGEINEAKDSITKLHHEVRDGYESAEREVRIERNFESGLRMIYDNKTEQFLGSEPLTAGDRQLDALEDVEENERREAALSSHSDNHDIDEDGEPPVGD